MCKFGDLLPVQLRPRPEEEPAIGRQTANVEITRICHMLASDHAINCGGNFRIDMAIYLEKTAKKTLMWNSSKNFNIKEKCANLGIFHRYS